MYKILLMLVRFIVDTYFSLFLNVWRSIALASKIGSSLFFSPKNFITSRKIFISCKKIVSTVTKKIWSDFIMICEFLYSFKNSFGGIICWILSLWIIPYRMISFNRKRNLKETILLIFAVWWQSMWIINGIEMIAI